MNENSCVSPLAGLPVSELQARRERLLEFVNTRSLRGCVLFDASYVRYFSNFAFLATERPVALVLASNGGTAAFVPAFEVDRVRSEGTFDCIESYPEYPGENHPMFFLNRVLADMSVTESIGADQDGYPGILGYEGPSLSEVTGSSLTIVAPFVEGMMRLKSEAEVELIRESAVWCARAHRLLQEYSRPGATETETSLRATTEATLEMFSTLGYVGQQASSDGASAGYRGQIGLKSAWAHALAHNISLQEHDLLVSETGAPIWGYNAELERAMIVGDPDDEVRWLFDHMVAAQQVAFDAIRPGSTCADVDRAVLGYFEDNGLLGFWRQHTGHAIGLRNHEAPFLDVGDTTRLEPGMVFTVEPGLYSEKIGGLRHSDTVVVRDDGVELLTDYPTDIESLTIPV